MHLVETFVKSPVKVAVGVLMVVLFGIVTLLRMPMQLTPEVEIPTITIETRWPGASPGEVEREIVQEQEEQLASVEGVTKMSSESSDSMGVINLEFDTGTDMQQALVKVNSNLQQVREYPEDADEPVIKTSSSSSNAIAWFILSARMPTEDEIKSWQAQHPKLAAELEEVRTAHNQGLGMLRLRRVLARRFAELKKTQPDVIAQYRPVKNLGLTEAGLKIAVSQHPQLADAAAISTLLPPDIDVPKQRKFVEDFIESELERVEGVANSDVFGGEEEELQVIVDPRELAHRGLTIADVRRVLRDENLDSSAGDFSEGKRRWVVRTRGQFREPKQVEEQVLGVFDGKHVFVRDVAEVRIGYKKPESMVRRFGVSSIAVNAQRTTGANVLEVMEGLREKNRQLNAGLLADKGMQLTQVYDETEYINSAIGLVQSNIVSGSILTAVILLIFLRSPRSTLIVFLAIPTSIIGTFLLMGMMGRSLNVISLAGLAFAVGMLVDNSIVVLDNIYRHYQNGETPFRAAVRGTNEVWGAVIASTLTTLAVFIPVVFVEQQAGQLFRDIALAISAAVGLSLIVSATVIPVAAARLLKRQNKAHESAVDAAANNRRESRHPLQAFADAFVGSIVGINRWAIRGWVRSLVMIVCILVVTFGLMWALWPKVEYLPTGNRNLAIGLIFPPPGYNIDELTLMGQWVEDELQPYWDVDPESPEAKGQDYPVIGDWFYVARGRQVFLGIRAYDDQKSGKLAELIRNKLNGRLPGAFVTAFQSSLFANGLDAGRTIDIEITGPELEKLVGYGGQVIGQVGEVAALREQRTLTHTGEVVTEPHPSGSVATVKDASGAVIVETRLDESGSITDVVDGRGETILTTRQGTAVASINEGKNEIRLSGKSGRKTLKYEGELKLVRDADTDAIVTISDEQGNLIAEAVRDHEGTVIKYIDGRRNELASSVMGAISIRVAPLPNQTEAAPPDKKNAASDPAMKSPPTQLIVITNIIEAAQARPVPSLDLSSPEIHVTPRRVEAAEYDVNASDLGYTVNALVDGAYATDYYQDGTKIDLTIKGKDDYARQTHDIESLPIATPTGNVIPLMSVADVELNSGPEQVNRRERQRAITIQVTPPLTVPLAEAIDRINAQVVEPMRASGQLEGGYSINLSGTADKLREAWDALGFNLVLAVFITYLLMAALFESWIYPLVIILSVPVAAVGGIVGLQLCSAYVVWQGFPPQTLDVLTMLGFVILVGTAVNNPILIVNQALFHMRHEGYGQVDAILEAVRNRIRPIFMTTTTTVFGLIPLVLMPGAGSELYRGLGAVVLGGLIASTIVSLVLVPVVLNIFMDIRNGFMQLLFGRTEAERIDADEPASGENAPALDEPRSYEAQHAAAESYNGSQDETVYTARPTNGEDHGRSDDPHSKLVS